MFGMSNKWPKVIRDPVHDIVLFNDTPCDRLLIDLINTKEFQRLRRIKQLGMSEMVFPGANHSRFAHSIGTMHVTRKFLAQLQREVPDVKEEQQTIVLAGALLHDIGHAPFSHAFEKVTGKDHESWTLEVIKSSETEVHQKLAAYAVDLPERVATFLDEKSKNEDLTKMGVPACLRDIVSSQLDADRFDYLLRDSHATGTDYGRFDITWLLSHLGLTDNGERLCLGRKALFGTESYLFARYHMYRVVYFHKAARAAEVMLRLLFGRLKELLAESTSDSERAGLVPGAPERLLGAFMSEMSLGDFLRLDDSTVAEFFKVCDNSGDETIRELGVGLANRKLFKGMDVTDVPQDVVADIYVRARDAVRDQGLDERYALVSDTATDTPYLPYNPDEENPATQIYVENSRGVPCEISTLSPAVETLKRKYGLIRYYYPEKVRHVIEGIASTKLERD